MDKRYGRNHIARVFEHQLSLIAQSFGYLSSQVGSASARSDPIFPEGFAQANIDHYRTLASAHSAVVTAALSDFTIPSRHQDLEDRPDSWSDG